MDNRDPHEELKPELGDYALIAAKTITSLIPVAGSPLAELLDLITPPLARRRDHFILALANDIRVLKEQGIRIEERFQDEAFVSSVLQASQIAQRTHQEEKLKALRNAILNIALEKSPEEDLVSIFLNWVDVFTSWHLRILRFFAPRNFKGPPGTGWIYTGFTIKALWRQFPDLYGHGLLCEQIVKDLYMHGLVKVSTARTGDITLGRGHSYTTNIGEQFLAFVTSPFEDDTDAEFWTKKLYEAGNTADKEPEISDLPD